MITKRDEIITKVTEIMDQAINKLSVVKQGVLKGEKGILIEKVKENLIPDDYTKLWKYVQVRGSESLFIKFMVTAFAALLRHGRNDIDNGMKFTVPFFAMKSGSLKRFCTKSDQMCSNQGVGMYYPFDINETEKSGTGTGTVTGPFEVNAMDTLQTKAKTLFVKKIIGEAGTAPDKKVTEIYPIISLLDPLLERQGTETETQWEIKNDDIKGVVVVPSGGLDAVYGANNDLMRAILGEYPLTPS